MQMHVLRYREQGIYRVRFNNGSQGTQLIGYPRFIPQKTHHIRDRGTHKRVACPDGDNAARPSLLLAVFPDKRENVVGILQKTYTAILQFYRRESLPGSVGEVAEDAVNKSTVAHDENRLCG